MPDWQFQPCVIPRMAFLSSDRINKMNKMTSEKVNGADSVHSVEKSLPNWRRIYVAGKLDPVVRVPLREMSRAPTQSINGDIEVNEPVRLYDTSGLWGDHDFTGDVTQVLS